MHRFDERFARQYRYELPPGFPLALSYPSIVHHLSGPIMHTFTLTLFGRASGWASGAAAPKFGKSRLPLLFTFVSRQFRSNMFGFDHQNARVHVRLLGPCFKTGHLNLFCWQVCTDPSLNFR